MPNLINWLIQSPWHLFFWTFWGAWAIASLLFWVVERLNVPHRTIISYNQTKPHSEIKQ